MSRLVYLVLLLPIGTAAAIESVTVFPDRATVSRVVEQSVDEGGGELVQTDLPAGLNRDSLRISAAGPEGLRLGAFEFETRRGSEQVDARARELESRIEALRDQRAVLDDALQARQMQLTLLQSLAGGAGEGEGKLALDGWSEAMRTLGEGAEEVLDGRRRIQLEQRELDREIERLERELADLGQQQRDTLELRLAYTSATAGRAEFTIEYTVGGASWRPVYEWRLDTDNARLTIIQSAEVRQRTGEDWDNASISLSLARPSAGGRLPVLEPWWIDVAQPEPETRRARAEADSAGLSQGMVMAESPAPAEWSGAELAGTEYTQRYDIAGRASVAGDNQPNRFRLAEHALDVGLSARTVPRRQATAWLYAEGEYAGDVALPPGPATLYQDQTMVGQLRFAGAAPGGELASSFGVDDRIEVDYRLLEDERASEGMIRKSTRLMRHYRIELSSGHSRPIDVTVLDQMPVSRDERIEVGLTDATTAPDERDVDDKPGVLAWHRRLGAGATETIDVGYRATFPEDLEGIRGW